MSSIPQQQSFQGEPSADDDGVIVSTETYQLTPEQNSSIHDFDLDEVSKVLPQAFASLASSATVRLGLDHDEEQLFDTILNTTLAYERGEINLHDDDENPPEPLQVRVAGGWVRDKLLGLQTHDVDITIDKMMGASFATLIQKYLLSLPLSHPARCQTKYPKIGVIAANPAQSKHLETATMRVHNIDIDVCHLRAEEIYQEDSRIPTVSIGTPFQDAQRRDFTLNSMFYNLKTKQVEDWTRRGMSDLRHRRLVTPLDAETTFQDDPLRVLRAIRFSVRYQLELDEGLKAACQLPKIHKALQVKVSRERVGKELEGMLSGKGANPQLAMATIGQLKLAGCVFCFPTTGQVINNTKITENPRGDLLGHDYHGDHVDMHQLREVGWEESQRLLEFMPALSRLHRQLPKTSTKLAKRLFPLAVFLLPFRFLRYDSKKTGNPHNTSKRHAVTTYMFQESIKFKNKDVQGIGVLMDNVDPMVKLLSDLADQQQGKESEADAVEFCRLEAGLLLRSTKELWVTTLLLACIVRIRGQERSSNSNNSTDWLKLAASAYKTILELNLEECWKAKPLLDGKAVIAALELPRGPIISTYLEEQTRWMLLNPEGTREECKEHLLSVKRRRESEDGGTDGNEAASQHPRLR